MTLFALGAKAGLRGVMGLSDEAGTALASRSSRDASAIAPTPVWQRCKNSRRVRKRALCKGKFIGETIRPAEVFLLRFSRNGYGAASNTCQEFAVSTLSAMRSKRYKSEMDSSS